MDNIHWKIKYTNIQINIQIQCCGYFSFLGEGAQSGQHPLWKEKNRPLHTFLRCNFCPIPFAQELSTIFGVGAFFFSLSPFGNFCVFFVWEKIPNCSSSSCCCSILTFLTIFMPPFMAQLMGSCPFGHSPCAPLSLTISFPTSFMQGNMPFMVHSINCNVTTLGHAHLMIAYQKEYNLNDLFILSLQKLKQDIASRTLRIVRCPNENL